MILPEHDCPECGYVFGEVPPERVRRPCVYAGEDRDVLWIARQALHEARHHLGDASTGLVELS